MHWSKVYLFFQISNQKKHSADLLSFCCLYDRFAKTEAVAVLSILVSQFKMIIKEEPQFAAETFDLSKGKQGFCLLVLV
jgi:hypothetical protein